MTQDTPHRPATRAEIVEALALGLRLDSRGKPSRVAADAMAQLAANQLADYLERAGFVLLRRPPGAAHRTP